MNRDEVNAMSDEELRATAYLLVHKGECGYPVAFCPSKKRPLIEILNDRADPIPNYHNDWDAVGELVDYMQRIPEGGGPRLEIELSSDVGEWQCQVGYEGWPCGPVAIGYADTAKLAITRAFVMAMASKEDDEGESVMHPG